MSVTFSVLSSSTTGTCIKSTGLGFSCENFRETAREV